MQTRSADEPMTTFVTCLNCNNRYVLQSVFIKLLTDTGLLLATQMEILVVHEAKEVLTEETISAISVYTSRVFSFARKSNHD